MNESAPLKGYSQREEASKIECRQHALCIAAGLRGEKQCEIYFLYFLFSCISVTVIPFFSLFF